AVGLLAVPAACWAVLVCGVELLRLLPDAAAQLTKADAELLAGIFKEGSEPPPTDYLGVMRARLQEYPTVAVLLASRVPSILALFLLGMAAE
ncbi:hypothetical protein, partial [Klebsiella pneumoniae]|uniref:hypothetical protein n=1 Tax=Klebsiella pneumoniae TaxID=573 RepID=UPI0030131606